ncbi:MAG: ABC transporter ATP-binding protein [Planctomycetota bacterium]
MLITVERLSKRFKNTQAVDSLSFSFESGQIFAFVGPNGAGKTTTMRIMSTLDWADEGEVFFDDLPVAEYPEKARRLMGFMPDALPEHRDIVVHEYLDFFARAFGLRSPHRGEMLAELEEFVGIGHMRNKTIKSLSKGMKQRVSLARALVHDPPVLILDEPAAGLDPRARIELRELLVALAQRGKAILISSHILNELEEISHGAVIIERGRLVRAGTMDAIHHDPELHADDRTRRMTIRPIRGVERVQTSALEHPAVLGASLVGDFVEVEVRGDDEMLAGVLGHVVRAGHDIVEFRPSKVGLEKLFMDVTKGEVQ